MPVMRNCLTRGRMPSSERGCAAPPTALRIEKTVTRSPTAALSMRVSVSPMTSPACPAGPQLIGGAKQQVSSIDGVHNVEVKIVLDPPWTPDRMTEDAKDQLGIF